MKRKNQYHDTCASSDFESLNQDVLFRVMEMVGKNSYATFGSINKKCNKMFDTYHLPKKTCIALLPITHVKDLYIERKTIYFFDRAIANGIVFLNSKPLLEWCTGRSIHDDTNLLQEICCVAAAQGRNDILDKVINGVDRVDRYQEKLVGDSDICIHAASKGKLETLKWLKTNTVMRNDDELWLYAARNSHINVLTWLHAKGYQWNSKMYGRTGRVDVLEWLHDSGCPRDDESYIEAAELNNLNAIKWLYQKGCPWDNEGEECLIFQHAATTGNFEMCKFLHENGCPWNEGASHEAALYNHFELLKWLRRNGCPWNEATFEDAASTGNIEMCKWMLENGCPWGSRACYNAAMNNHFEMLQWLCRNGCPLNADNCEGAASNGNLTMLKWCHAHGCPMGYTTWCYATESGNLEMVQWLISKGFSLHAHNFRYAACKGHLHMMNWMHMMGCAWDVNYTISDVQESYLCPEKKLEVLQWIQAHR